MGFLTTVTLHNDAMHAFKEHPEEFAEALFKGMNEANMGNKCADVGFRNYGGYIQVQHSRHADDHTIFVHMGNCVINVNLYEQEFKELVKRNPDFAKRIAKHLKETLKGINELLK